MSEEMLSPFPLGEIIRVPTQVILSRDKTTPRDLAEIRRTGTYEPGPDAAICELRAGDATVASGRLVKKSGRWYMQIETVGGNT